MKEQTARTEQAQQELLAKPTTQAEAQNAKQEPAMPPQPASNHSSEQTSTPADLQQSSALRPEQSAVQPHQEVAQETKQQPIEQASQPSVQQPIQQPTPQTVQRIKPSADKTRSLSAKLFDRKKEHPKQRRK